MHASRPDRRRLLTLFAAAPLAACASRSPSTGADFTAEPLAQALARRPVTLLGEVHDNPVQHRVRAEAVGLLLDGGARPAIAFEQFDRDTQAALDQARRDSAGEQIAARADRLIKAASRGNWNWTLYRPFVELALRHDVPIVAANLSRADAMKVGRAEGFDAAFDREIQRRLGLDRLDAAFLKGHERAVDDGHCNTMPPHLLVALARSQIARDAALLLAVRPYRTRGVVLLTGNGHARKDLGVPALMDADERAATLSIGLLETPANGADDHVASLRPNFDLVFITPRHVRPDPCEELRRRSAK